MSSRAFYLGLPALVGFYFVFIGVRYYQTKNKVEIKKIIPVFVSCILAFFIFNFVQDYLYPKSDNLYNNDFSGRLATISVSEGGGYRLKSWSQTSNLIKENPLLGVGLGNWKIAVLEYENPTKSDFIYHLKTHNDFLEVTSEVGVLGFLCFLALFLFTFYNLVNSLFIQKSTKQLDLLFLSSFGLLAYSFDAFFNFPQDRPEIQALFVIYLGLSIGISPQSLTKDKFKLFSPALKSDLPNTSNYSKLILISLFVISLISSYVLYLNFKSLQIQRILNEEQVTGKTLVDSEFLLANFPKIPNLSSSSDPINGLIGKKLNDEKKYEEALNILKNSNPNPFDSRREIYLAYAHFG